MISIRPVLALSVAGALVLSACGGDDDSSDSSVIATPAINVGRTTEPVSQLIAEVYGQGLENAGYRIGRKDPVADQAATMAGLEAGTLQLVPEFSSEVLSYLEANGGAGSDATAIADQMTALREQLTGTLTVFEPANVDDGTVIACSAAAIDEFTLAAISDLADTEVTLGSTSEFADATVGGLAALNTAYGTELTVTESDDVAAAIVDGTVDCGALTALDHVDRPRRAHRVGGRQVLRSGQRARAAHDHRRGPGRRPGRDRRHQRQPDHRRGALAAGQGRDGRSVLRRRRQAVPGIRGSRADQGATG